MYRFKVTTRYGEVLIDVDSEWRSTKPYVLSGSKLGINFLTKWLPFRNNSSGQRVDDKTSPYEMNYVLTQGVKNKEIPAFALVEGVVPS